MTLSQDIINLVNRPPPPPWRQAGAHGGHAGWLAGLEKLIALGLPAHEAAGLRGKVIEGADE